MRSKYSSKDENVGHEVIIRAVQQYSVWQAVHIVVCSARDFCDFWKDGRFKDVD